MSMRAAPGSYQNNQPTTPRPCGPIRSGCSTCPSRREELPVNWLEPLERLREQRRPGVLVTLAAVRGHAPREAGAKMVVASDRTWGTIGGGNLEAVAVSRARALLVEERREPEMLTVALSEKAPFAYGGQCCGGEGGMFFGTLPLPPPVSLFWRGHLGL